MQRDAIRAQADQVRAQAATAWRDAERARAAHQHAQAEAEKERKRLYAESRMADVAAMNYGLGAAVKALEGLLAAALKTGDLVSSSSLKKWQAAVNAANVRAYGRHQEIDAFEACYRRGDLDAIVSYCSLVLEASRYPDGFPQQFKFAYVPESRQAAIEYELPTVEVVPTVKAYRYVKSSDTIAESALPQSQIKAL